MTYSLNNSKATAKRVTQLQLSDTNVNDMLLTSEGRRTIGYNYLVSYNPPQEIDYEKEGKNYNCNFGPNRLERRGTQRKGIQ